MSGADEKATSRVLVLDDSPFDVPRCPHGPMVLFQRVECRRNNRPFFACSACRDRKDCQFFFWADQKISEGKREQHEKVIDEMKVKYNHKQLFKFFKSLLESDTRKFCGSCNMFFVEDSKHDKCENVRTFLTDEELTRKPLTLFTPKQDKKREAQFYFSDQTVQFMTSLFEETDEKPAMFDAAICIGTPSIHSKLRYDTKPSFLLDIDWKLCQIFSPKNFAQFNLCNSWFFTEEGQKSFDKFVGSLADKTKLLVLVDPPYGVKPELLRRLVDSIQSMTPGLSPEFILCMPYFCEKQILANIPQMKMTDYKIKYGCNRHYSGNTPRGSPSRIYTTIKLHKFRLPEEEGYYLCKKSRAWQAAENVYCPKCKTCPTKDGPTYVHCDKCKTCVKPSYKHCAETGRCQLPPTSGSSGAKNSRKRKAGTPLDQ